MRAILVEEYGGPEALVVRELPDPEPGPGEVTISVAYAGVNYAEIMGRRGLLKFYRAPFVPGMEVSGTVRAIGPGVEGLRVGEPVAALTTVGGYAEVVVARAQLTYALGDDLDLRAGAAFPIVVPTAWALIHDVARVRPGESVLVHAAAGGVGSAFDTLAANTGSFARQTSGLASGGAQLTSGAQSLASGATSLASGLNSGASKAPSYTAAPPLPPVPHRSTRQ